MNNLMPYVHVALELLGGAIAIKEFASRSAIAAAPHLVDVAMDTAFKHPRVAAALSKYRPQIEAFFDAADAEMKKRLDANAGPAPDKVA